MSVPKMTPEVFKSWMDLRKADASAGDVVTDGAGNVYSRKCPRCGNLAVTRVAYGTCRCKSCGA